MKNNLNFLKKNVFSEYKKISKFFMIFRKIKNKFFVNLNLEEIKTNVYKNFPLSGFFGKVSIFQISGKFSIFLISQKIFHFPN